MFDYSRKPVKWQVGNFSYIICDAGGASYKRWIPFNPNTKTPKLKYKKL